MVNKTGELATFGDCRWLCLLALGLILIVGGFLRRPEIKAEPAGDALNISSWQKMDLRWESDGPLGQGVYYRRASGVGLGAEAAMVADEGLVEPRLAVFTFRPLDINRIDFDTLRVLPGVGPKMAAAIIGYRQTMGPFRRVEELLEVKGVGPAKFKVLCRSLAVQTPSTS